jgi:hypothetical protein
MMYVIGLHGMMMMIEKGERRQVAATVICTLCVLCMLCRSHGSLAFYGAGGLHRYLESKGVALVDVGVALIFYEMTGMLALVSFWVTCFLTQPLKHGILEPLLSLCRGCREVFGMGDFWIFRAALCFGLLCSVRAEELYNAVHDKVKSKFHGIAATMRVDSVRLTTAYCEGNTHAFVHISTVYSCIHSCVHSCWDTHCTHLLMQTILKKRSFLFRIHAHNETDESGLSLGAVIRGMCKPLLVPLKLYLTYCMLCGWRLGYQRLMMSGLLPVDPPTHTLTAHHQL